MEYQLNRPCNCQNNCVKIKWFNEIIEYCDNMTANEKLIIFDFGEKADLLLNSYKDEDYRKKTDDWNLVVIIL